jgi:acyl-CoA dehydrogenase
MKVTTQGEDVINLLWDVIAAKGFEKDMFFEQAAVDIRALPKLEGTVHVNIALIVKFMANYFFAPADYPEVAQQSQAANDDFLFDQGPTKGLGKIRFHDYNIAYSSRSTPNLQVFKEQIEAFKQMLFAAPPDEGQRKDIDFLLAGGEIFALVVYGQLILENANIYGVSDDLVDQIFDFMVRDFSRHALNLYSKPSSSETQMKSCLQMIKKPTTDEARYGRVWNEVHGLRDAYTMNP